MVEDFYRLFVYGSLRSGLHNDVFTFISSYFVLEGMGHVQGKLYDLGEYPGAIPTTENYQVLGELYRIADRSDLDWAIQQIDDYEGYVVSDGKASLFRRELANIAWQDTTMIAWVYWYNQPINDQPQILSGDYVAYKMGLGK